MTPFDEAETVEMKPNPNEEFAKGLEEMAAWFRANPQLPKHYGEYVCLFFQDKAELQAALPGLGKLTKEKNDSYFKLTRNFPGGNKVGLLLEHEQMCERRVTGTKVIPAKPARTVELPAEPERVEEVYEWVCPDSVLAPTGVARIAE